MRIAFLTPEYVTEGYFSGGLANSINRTAAALTAAGHEIHVFTGSNLRNENFVADRVTVHRMTSGSVERWLRSNSMRQLDEVAQWIDLMVAAYQG
jgi:hypothetical protein